jgi:hypothetical protein
MVKPVLQQAFQSGYVTDSHFIENFAQVLNLHLLNLVQNVLIFLTRLHDSGWKLSKQFPREVLPKVGN